MSATKTTRIEELLESRRGIILEIGSATEKQPGAVRIDREPAGDTDLVIDWMGVPWPLPDECAVTILAKEVVEHVSPLNGGFLAWMDECWRVLKPNRQMVISYPYGGNSLFIADPTHVNPCNEFTWFYFAPDHPSGLWETYRPLPWVIELNAAQRTGTGEVVLRKRAL